MEKKKEHGTARTTDDLHVIIAGRDIGDFYQMVREYSMQRGNTFHFLWNELKERYPHIAKDYGDM